MRAPARLLVSLLAAAAATGCGAERTEAPNVGVRPGEPTKEVRYPGAGITAAVPARFRAVDRPRPGVFRVVIADAVIAAHAYRRKEQLPRSTAALGRARRGLVAEVRRRDGDFELESSRVTEVDGARAVELRGDQTLGQERVRTRSVHVYKGSAEYVLELIAPSARFAELDRNAFSPMLRSLELTGEVRRPRAD